MRIKTAATEKIFEKSKILWSVGIKKVEGVVEVEGKTLYLDAESV